MPQPGLLNQYALQQDAQVICECVEVRAALLEGSNIVACRMQRGTLSSHLSFSVPHFPHSFQEATSLGSTGDLSAAAAAESLQSCPTLCNPIDGSPPGSALPGILQARTLEWVTISFSNAWKWKVKVKLLSCVRLFETPWTAAYQAPPSMGLSRQETSLQSFKMWHVDPTAELLIELVQGGTRKTGIANEAPWVILTCTTPKHGLLQNCPVAE